MSGEPTFRVRDAMITEPRALPVTATAREAGEVLTPAEVRAVYVVGAEGELIGVVTRKTLVARVVAEGRNPGETTVGSLAEQPYYTIDAETPLDEAFRFIEEHDGSQNGRVKGFLSPLQVDTCTADLLRKSRNAAVDMGVPLALHTSQSVNEFLEMTQRHGLTPIEWLREIGFLGPEVILGHAIIVAPGMGTPAIS